MRLAGRRRYNCLKQLFGQVKEAGRFPIQVHEEDSKNKLASDHLPRTNLEEHRRDKTSKMELDWS